MRASRMIKPGCALLLSALSLLLMGGCPPGGPTFILGDAFSASTFTADGIVYSVQPTAEGGLDVTTSEGAEFSKDASGRITRVVGSDGTVLTFTYNADGTLTATGSIPGYGTVTVTVGVGAARVKGEALAKDEPVVCEEIKELCEELERFVNAELTTAKQELIEQFLRERGDDAKEGDRSLITQAIESTINRLQEFCAGWSLMLLIDQDPCSDTPASPSAPGTFEVVFSNDLGMTVAFRVTGFSGQPSMASVTVDSGFYDTIAFSGGAVDEAVKIDALIDGEVVATTTCKLYASGTDPSAGGQCVTLGYGWDDVATLECLYD